MRRSLKGTVGLAILLGLAQAAQATRTRSFLLEGVETFRKAEIGGAAVHDDGSVGPSLRVRTVVADAGAQVWGILRSQDGTIYVGTGSNGEVLRLAGGETPDVLETGEVELFALAEGTGGRIYAAGAPNGTIVEIGGDQPRTVFDPPEMLIWALVTDRDGTLYAGTGERGLLYRIDPDGEASVLYRAGDEHLVTLAWSAEGKLLAGTDGRGLLLEIDPEGGEGRVLYDAPDPEITAIAVAPRGEVYFASSSGIGMPRGTEGEEDNGESSGGNDSDGEGSHLFIRELDGSIRTLWESPEVTIHALLVDRNGTLFAATAEEAALYRIEPTGEATLLWKPEVGQVLALALDGESILAGTGNPGRLYRIGPERDGEAWIRPEPIAVAGEVRWGRVSWEVLPGSGGWELRTRSGQTERPDSTWSGWSEPLTSPDGSLVESPPARFLQCEARYRPGGSGPPARLRQIWIPYGEPNRPPRVRRIRFSPVRPSSSNGAQEGTSFVQDLGAGVRVQIQRSTVSVNGNASETTPPWVGEVRSISWDAEDPNGDPLRYELSIRRVGDARFRTLVRDHPIAAYAIDTRTLPEGAYEVRVRASDHAANPPGEGREGSRIGGPFRVDHRPPEFESLTARRIEPLRLLVEGKVRDRTSPIRRLEVSWDGRAWQPAPARDGFLDGAEETFRIEINLEREDEGSWVAVRASDATGNEAIERVWLQD